MSLKNKAVFTIRTMLCVYFFFGPPKGPWNRANNQPTAIQQTHFQHSERLQELNNFSQTRKEHTNSGSKKTTQFLSIMKGIHQIVE